MKDDDFIIKVLKYATEKDEFTFEELCISLAPTDIQKTQLMRQVEVSEILGHAHVNYSNFLSANKAPKTKLYASTEDHFRLLEYQELKEARASSVVATKFATGALTVSIITAIISTCISIKSMNSEISFPEEFYSYMKKIDGDVAKTSNKALNSPTAGTAKSAAR
jgi:hypothetical protein